MQRVSDKSQLGVTAARRPHSTGGLVEDVASLIRLHRDLSARYQAYAAVLERSAYRKVFGDFIGGHQRSIELLLDRLNRLDSGSLDELAADVGSQSEDDVSVLRLLLAEESHLKQEYMRNLSLWTGSAELEAELTLNKGETTKRLGWLEGELNMLEHTGH